MQVAAAKRELIVAGRFNGPPNSGNGGYVCGMLAREVDGAAQVTLRRPPALDRPMQLQCEDDGRRQLLDGDQLVAEVAAVESLALEVPPAPSLAEAEASAQHFRGFHQHTFPTCFVCGPERAEGDGLRIFAGPVGERGLVASPWVPAAEFAAADGTVQSQFVWAALDCPGAYALLEQGPKRPVLLGRLSAQILAPLRAGERYIIAGWPMGSEGRKHYAGTAVYAADGTVLALARAIWIEFEPAG